jgi:CARDB
LHPGSEAVRPTSREVVVDTSDYAVGHVRLQICAQRVGQGVKRGGGRGPADCIDLSVTGLAPLATGPICAGTSPTFGAYIHNSGPIASGGFDIAWYADSGTFLGGHYSIPAGADDTHDHIWSHISAGSHTLTFVANFDNLVGESNKGNNQATMTFEVAESPSPTP